MASANVRVFPVKVKDLHFDLDNPRLPENVEKAEGPILKYLATAIGVEDLLLSMAESGFVDGDPMIVKEADSGEGYVVIEGNRRLAALKLLTEGTFTGGPRLPLLAAGVADTLSEVSVQSGWDHDDLIAYLGYKHVTAAREWGPEAKARFVIHNAKGDFSDNALRKFARELGTKLGVLKRWLVAYYAIEQAKTSERVDEELLANRRVFGTFYTLLGSEQVKEFVGLESDAIKEKPISKEDNFEEFLGWLVGTKDQGPVINSRDQKDLSRILANEYSLDYFRSHKDLKAALRYVTASKDEVAATLRQASYLIDNIVPELRSQREEEKVRGAFLQLRKSFETANILFGEKGA